MQHGEKKQSPNFYQSKSILKYQTKNYFNWTTYHQAKEIKTIVM